MNKLSWIELGKKWARHMPAQKKCMLLQGTHEGHEKSGLQRQGAHLRSVDRGLIKEEANQILPSTPPFHPNLSPFCFLSGFRECVKALKILQKLHSARRGLERQISQLS